MCPSPAVVSCDPAAKPMLIRAASERADMHARRPRLLMSAARHGLGEYQRGRDLARLLGHCPITAVAVVDLTEMEATAEAARRAGSPAWSCTRHVEVLIALLAERALSTAP